MKSRSAIKIDLFADQCRRKKIESLGEPRAEIKLHIDFAAQAGEVDRIARRPVSRQGGRPPYPTKTMMGIPVFKRPYNPSDEQMEPTPLDCVNYKRFCGLESAPNIPDRTTVWTFESQIEKASAKALSDDASSQQLYKVVIARDDRCALGAAGLEAREAAPEVSRFELAPETR